MLTIDDPESERFIREAAHTGEAPDEVLRRHLPRRAAEARTRGHAIARRSQAELALARRHDVPALLVGSDAARPDMRTA